MNATPLSPIVLLVLAAVCLLLAGCASSPKHPPIPPGIAVEHLHFENPDVEPGDMAPDFTLALADGRAHVTLSDLRGTPVVLVFGSFT